MISPLPDTTAVKHLLDRYVAALYAGDVDGLGALLHPQGLYATATGGTLLRHAIPDYLEVVAARPRPGERESDQVHGVDRIEIVGGTMAHARLHCRLFGRDYVDFLTLLKVDGRWWIVAKCFHYDERSH